MAYQSEHFFENFFAYKDSLNRQFHQGDLSKKEYIEESHRHLMNLNQPPYRHVDHPYKALYNYQYYNMTGKYSQLRLKELEKSGKHPDKEQSYKTKIRDCYYQKDKSTLQLLELLEYRDVQAYYIKVRSKDLKKRLFEVVIDSEEIKAVLHSVNPLILERLTEYGLFDSASRSSVIDGYINTRY